MPDDCSPLSFFSIHFCWLFCYCFSSSSSCSIDIGDYGDNNLLFLAVYITISSSSSSSSLLRIIDLGVLVIDSAAISPSPPKHYLTLLRILYKLEELPKSFLNMRRMQSQSDPMWRTFWLSLVLLLKIINSALFSMS